jgi:hypothetical protein
MSEREKEWWQTDVARVMQETEDFYTRVAAVNPDKAKLPFTKKKTIEVRGWASTLRMYEKNFESVLKQLGFFYIPNRLVPGPAFIFPIQDAEGKFTSAQTKPLECSVLSGLGKYRYIGSKPFSPRWLGNDHATLKKIIDGRKVMVVEGPFDLLAVRLLCPEVPIISPLTKVVGVQHRAYLRMLGVTDLLLMYDNEEAKEGKTEGAGNLSMIQQTSTIKEMRVTPLFCPKSDPSECLKNELYAEKLRKIIQKQFRY